jgi:hypothetical protein
MKRIFTSSSTLSHPHLHLSLYRTQDHENLDAIRLKQVKESLKQLSALLRQGSFHWRMIEKMIAEYSLSQVQHAVAVLQASSVSSLVIKTSQGFEWQQ